MHYVSDLSTIQNNVQSTFIANADFLASQKWIQTRLKNGSLYWLNNFEQFKSRINCPNIREKLTPEIIRSVSTMLNNNNIVDAFAFFKKALSDSYNIEDSCKMFFLLSNNVDFFK